MNKDHQKIINNITKSEIEIIKMLKQVLITVISLNKEFQKIENKAAIVGGWVRDKYLNKDSNDIDLCLNKKIYKEFVQELENRLKMLSIIPNIERI